MVTVTKSIIYTQRRALICPFLFKNFLKMDMNIIELSFVIFGLLILIFMIMGC